MLILTENANAHVCCGDDKLCHFVFSSGAVKLSKPFSVEFNDFAVVDLFFLFQCLIFILCLTGVQLLALLVPTLVSYLLDENAIFSAPQVSIALHDFALQNLMRIGPLYPAAFKIVIGAAPELKIRLESAIRANQASSRAKAAARLAQPTVQAAPTIKLKTSFF